MGLVVGAGLLIIAAFFVSNARSGLRMFGQGEHYSKVGQSVVDKVRDLAALTTVEVVESTTIDKGNDFGWLNWARGDRVFMFVVAKIGAGIDFEQFYTESFEVDTESGTVFVQMPPAQITYVAMDNAQTQVIDRDTGLFTKGDPKLESDARQVAEQVLRNAAIEAGILDRAQKNARTIIEGLLLELGYTRVVFGRDRESSVVRPRGSRFRRMQVGQETRERAHLFVAMDGKRATEGRTGEDVPNPRKVSDRFR
jgi:hypothetical protein